MFIEKFAKRVTSVLGRDVFVSVLNFFITTYIANLLGPEVFGLWIGILSLLAICDLLFRLKIDQCSVLLKGSEIIFQKVSGLFN